MGPRPVGTRNPGRTFPRPKKDGPPKGHTFPLGVCPPRKPPIPPFTQIVPPSPKVGKPPWFPGGDLGMGNKGGNPRLKVPGGNNWKEWSNGADSPGAPAKIRSQSPSTFSPVPSLQEMQDLSHGTTWSTAPQNLSPTALHIHKIDFGQRDPGPGNPLPPWVKRVILPRKFAKPRVPCFLQPLNSNPKCPKPRPPWGRKRAGGTPNPPG